MNHQEPALYGHVATAAMVRVPTHAYISRTTGMPFGIPAPYGTHAYAGRTATSTLAHTVGVPQSPNPVLHTMELQARYIPDPETLILHDHPAPKPQLVRKGYYRLEKKFELFDVLSNLGFSSKIVGSGSESQTVVLFKKELGIHNHDRTKNGFVLSAAKPIYNPRI
jgi:hypothetical protein